MGYFDLECNQKVKVSETWILHNDNAQNLLINLVKKYCSINNRKFRNKIR